MKKLFVLVAVLVLVLTGCGSKSDKEVLRVYNWGEYIDRDLITQFEKEHNVRVIYDLFESNEQMYNKLQDGSKYDVIIPSDYTVERMREEGLLQKIDYSKISNFEHIMPELLNRHMDPTNEYTVPYFWGNVGLLYNKNNVELSELEAQGWDILRNPKYKDNVFFYDSERDAFMVALKALGYSMNSSNEDELNKASDWLIDMKKEMNPVYVTDLVIDNMVNGIKDIAVMYSGDANYVLTENEDMGYYEPLQGTNTWVDAMVIPANAPNPELAHQWIDFMISFDGSKALTDEVGYTSPRLDVIEAVTGAGGDYEGVSSYVTRTGYKLDEQFHYDQDTKVILNNLWQRIIAIK